MSITSSVILIDRCRLQNAIAYRALVLARISDFNDFYLSEGCGVKNNSTQIISRKGVVL